MTLLNLHYSKTPKQNVCRSVAVSFPDRPHKKTSPPENRRSICRFSLWGRVGGGLFGWLRGFRGRVATRVMSS